MDGMSTLTKKTGCRMCGNTFATGGIHAHLKSCIKKTLATVASEAPQATIHLTIMGLGCYRLDLAVLESCTMYELDTFLRDIWLECCHHSSDFTDSKTWAYGDDEGMAEHENPELVQVGEFFRHDETFYHIYDPGDPTTLIIKEKGRWNGLFDALIDGNSVARCPHIRIMARNVPPETCPCGKPAEFWDMTYQGFGFLAYCRECSRGKTVRTLVNSPRDGWECFDEQLIKPEVSASDILPAMLASISPTG